MPNLVITKSTDVAKEAILKHARWHGPRRARSAPETAIVQPVRGRTLRATQSAHSGAIRPKKRRR